MSKNKRSLNRKQGVDPDQGDDLEGAEYLEVDKEKDKKRSGQRCTCKRIK